MTLPSPRRTNSGGRLAQEWARLRSDPRHLDTVNGWRLINEPVSDLNQLLGHAGFEVASTRATEGCLRDLVLIAGNDDLAARIVVQRLLPGLLAVARRRRAESDRALDELLGAMWIAIRTYNPRRSPRSIAASLISDADYAAFRSAHRRLSGQERPTDIAFDQQPAEHTASACEQLADLLRQAAEAGVSDDDLALVRQLLKAPNTAAVAQSMRVTTRTVRNRRDRITNRLREVALAA